VRRAYLAPDVLANQEDLRLRLHVLPRRRRVEVGVRELVDEQHHLLEGAQVGRRRPRRVDRVELELVHMPHAVEVEEDHPDRLAGARLDGRDDGADFLGGLAVLLPRGERAGRR